MQRLLERKYFYFAVFWTLFITYMSLVTIEKVNTSIINIPNKDKIVHFVFYFIFVFSWIKVFNSDKNKINLKIVVIAVLYGIIIEVLQSVFTTNRQADIFDAIANALGALTAFLFLRHIKNKS